VGGEELEEGAVEGGRVFDLGDVADAREDGELGAGDQRSEIGPV
jgi:hypothetical protein